MVAVRCPQPVAYAPSDSEVLSAWPRTMSLAVGRTLTSANATAPAYSGPQRIFTYFRAPLSILHIRVLAMRNGYGYEFASRSAFLC